MNELFSGIGAQAEGIKLTNKYELDVKCTSDIDKDAMLSYAAIHCGLTDELINTYYKYPSRTEMAKLLTDRNIGYDFKKNKPYNWGKLINKKTKQLEKYYLACVLSNNLGDISLINNLPYADFWTYSFPCQDISIAGLQKGIKKGETRSGLLYEVERLLKQSKDTNTMPKYLLLENVKNLVGSKFKSQFDDWISELSKMGYNTYWKVVNGKNCGVPQNRERVFALSIRKDIDNCQFSFKADYDSGLRLKDILEDNVDDKYYLSDEIQKRLQITDKSFTKNIVGTTKPSFRTIGQRDLVYQTNSTMGTLVATDYKQPKQILVKNAMKQIAQIYGTETEPNPQAGRIYDAEFISPTLDTCSGGNRMPKIVCELDDQQYNLYAVRKLTPKECWRLMGFSDECFNKAETIGMSDTQLYKQAGNSIITKCISDIMEQLYISEFGCNLYEVDENFIQPQAV